MAGLEVGVRFGGWWKVWRMVEGLEDGGRFGGWSGGLVRCMMEVLAWRRIWRLMEMEVLLADVGITGLGGFLGRLEYERRGGGR